MSGVDEDDVIENPRMRSFPVPSRSDQGHEERARKELALKARQQKISIAYLVVGTLLCLLLLHATTHYRFMHVYGSTALRGDNWTGQVTRCTPKGCNQPAQPTSYTVTAPAADATAMTP